MASHLQIQRSDYEVEAVKQALILTTLIAGLWLVLPASAQARTSSKRAQAREGAGVRPGKRTQKLWTGLKRALVATDARLRYHLHRWPRGTARRHRPFDADELKLFNRSTHGGEMGSWKVYGKDGKLLAQHEITSNDFFAIHPRDLVQGYDRALATARQHPGMIGRVSFTHTHNLLPHLGRWYSPGDRRFATQIRAFFNADGLGQVPFEMVLLHNRSFKREGYEARHVGKSVFSIPGGMTLGRDLHPGRKVTRHIQADQTQQ